MASQTPEPVMLSGLIEALSQAATYCNGLAHAQQRPVFLVMEQSLQAFKETAILMATSKAPSRQKVLKQIAAMNKDLAGKAH